jgi:hypothetical protein
MAAHPMAVQVAQAPHEILMVILAATLHIQAVAVEAEVVAAVVVRPFLVAQVDLVQFGNKHLIVQQQVRVVEAEELIGHSVVQVQAVYMAVDRAEAPLLVLPTLALKVLLFLHTMKVAPQYQVLQLLAQQQPLVLQQPTLHLPLQLVMVVQRLSHTQQQVVQVELLVH